MKITPLFLFKPILSGKEKQQFMIMQRDQHETVVGFLTEECQTLNDFW